jgi:hypothetical protein
MSNLLANWWRSFQFRSALKQGKISLAVQKLKEIEKSGARLSVLEQLFKNKLKTERYLHTRNQETVNLRETLKYKAQELAELQNKLNVTQPESNLLQPNSEFIQYVLDSFQITEHDRSKVQCTGIDYRIFEDFEASLADYLRSEFGKFSTERLEVELGRAIEDINKLKIGKNPKYNFLLTPHVYFMKYFLVNTYCAYLAWFQVYKEGLLPTQVNILDIAAGPGTIAYGLSLLLRSSSGFFDLPQMHLSYYSLEKQDMLQYRGLQFWRRYIEPQLLATNTYFRFDTTDIFNYDVKQNKIPKHFFDFIVISHCFFFDSEKRMHSHKIFKELFQNSLKEDGHVLLIFQDKKLFRAYDVRQSEDIDQEQKLVRELLAEMGLNLVWYKYFTSTDTRTPMKGSEFGKFAKKNLPTQKFMSSFNRQYLGLNFDLNYTLDDYVVLAKR